MVENRQYGYEIFVSVEGRWQIDAILEREEPALMHARTLLASGRYEEVKVVRNRAMVTGFTTKRDIFHEKRPVVKDPPLVIKGHVDRAGPCETVDDLYGLESRRIISRLFRQFLDKYQITATDLLHNWTFLRKLSDAGTLIGTATYQVAMAQAKETGGDARQRIRLLEGLIHQVMNHARDFAAERRRLPAFDPDQVDYVSHRVRAHVGPDNHAFAMLSLMAQYLLAYPSISGKLERVLDLWVDVTEPELAALYECFVADALMCPEVVKELIGPQANLGGSLVMLADVLTGRADTAKMAASLGRIARKIAEGRAPGCYTVLLDRVKVELKRDHPLDKKHPANEQRLLEEVVARLRGDDGLLIGGPEVEEAIVHRMMRQRQQMLRNMGLMDVADQLPSVWRPVIK